MATPNFQFNGGTLAAVNRGMGIVGLFVGCAVLLGGAYWVHGIHLDEFLQLMTRSVTAEGTVIENRPVEVNAQPNSQILPFTSYQAIVTFRDRSEKVVTLADSMAFSRTSFAVGQRVNVFYDPKNPQHAMIDRGNKNFIIPGICLVFGGLAILGSIQRLTRPLPTDSAPKVVKTFRLG